MSARNLFQRESSMFFSFLGLPPYPLTSYFFLSNAADYISIRRHHFLTVVNQFNTFLEEFPSKRLS